MKLPWEWNEQDILDLIANQVKEDLNLDYKACDSLGKSDGKKKEMSKDVSAFANSAGGVIIYGVTEDKHLPTAIDTGYDPTDISKEWVEQVINSSIKRRIDGVRINQVELKTTKPGSLLYVVAIPQSNRAPHMASDNRFYKAIQL
jgi:predicted HTH transcriptional regulator